MADGDQDAYELQPFETVFLQRRDEIVQLVNVTKYSLRSMNGHARLSKSLGKSEENITFVAMIENNALAEADLDFPLLHGAATVIIWGAMEAAVRDFLVRWLHRNEYARQVDDLRRIRVSVADYESVDGEDRMRFLIGQLERELGATLKPGVGRLECLLRPFGLNPRKDDALNRDLLELAAVRNVIVHRASVADKRLISLCPWLGVEEGATVNVSAERFQRYVHATSEYCARIVELAAEKLKQRDLDRDFTA